MIPAASGFLAWGRHRLILSNRPESGFLSHAVNPHRQARAGDEGGCGGCTFIRHSIAFPPRSLRLRVRPQSKGASRGDAEGGGGEVGKKRIIKEGKKAEAESVAEPCAKPARKAKLFLGNPVVQKCGRLVPENRAGAQSAWVRRMNQVSFSLKGFGDSKSPREDSGCGEGRIQNICSLNDFGGRLST